MRSTGRRGSNVADNYVDTGTFAASHGDRSGWRRCGAEPMLVTAEYDEARVDSPSTGNPQFHRLLQRPMRW